VFTWAWPPAIIVHRQFTPGFHDAPGNFLGDVYEQPPSGQHAAQALRRAPGGAAWARSAGRDAAQNRERPAVDVPAVRLGRAGDRVLRAARLAASRRQRAAGRAVGHHLPGARAAHPRGDAAQLRPPGRRADRNRGAAVRLLPLRRRGDARNPEDPARRWGGGRRRSAELQARAPARHAVPDPDPVARRAVRVLHPPEKRGRGWDRRVLDVPRQRQTQAGRGGGHIRLGRRRRRRARRAEGDPRLPRRPHALPGSRGGGAEGSAAGGAAGNR
jgi:hypothetical protein